MTEAAMKTEKTEAKAGDKEKLEITKATTMGDMLNYDMGIAYVLMQSGMHCVGCPSSIDESLEEACEVHGLDADEVLASINAYLAGRAEKAERACAAS